MHDSNKYILKVNEIEKSFTGVIALNKVSVGIKKGEIHGLIGKNGAGKSTLIKIISGIYEPDNGKIYFKDKEFDKLSPSLSRELGIQLVPQEQQYQPYMTVTENFILGSWPKTKTGFLNFRTAQKKTREALAKLKIEIPTQTLCRDLTVVERQLLAIAKAIFSKAKIIILDEPTPSLAENEIELLFGFIKDFSKKGITFIYISHYLNEIFDVCDSFSVLRDGKLIKTDSVKNITPSQLVKLMIGKTVKKVTKTEKKLKSEFIEISKLSSNGNFNDISFSIKKGEIIGLTGLLGCGSHSLAKTLFGIIPFDSGKITVDGKKIKTNSPEKALSFGIALLPEERRSLGLILDRSVEENINLSILKKLVNRIGFIKQREFRENAKKYIGLLNINTPSLNQEVRYLSGGNQQKIVVSRLICSEPRLLIMLDPTAGIDVEAKQEIYRIMQQLTSKEISILLLSSDLNELIDLSDRILVMHNGKIVKKFSEGSVERHDIQLASEGIIEE